SPTEQTRSIHVWSNCKGKVQSISTIGWTNFNAKMMRKEEFWGQYCITTVKLSKEKPSIVWKLDEEDDSELDIVTTLLIKQACLGASAKKDEVNVVEVCTVDYSGEEVQCPIVNLTCKGSSACSTVNATLHSPVELKLTAGSGPVHLSGCLEEVLVDMSEDEDEDEDEDADEDSEIKAALQKRGALDEGNGPVAKKNKQTPVKETSKKNDTKSTPSKTPAKSSEPMNVDEIKKKLGKSPNLPKKPEKFQNFMKHNFNVTSEEVIGNLWQWVSKQASKK
ncbi:Mitotic apparatus protein p62, partial [Trichoplax sp. H2]